MGGRPSHQGSRGCQGVRATGVTAAQTWAVLLGSPPRKHLGPQGRDLWDCSYGDGKEEDEHPGARLAPLPSQGNVPHRKSKASFLTARSRFFEKIYKSDIPKRPHTACGEGEAEPQGRQGWARGQQALAGLAPLHAAKHDAPGISSDAPDEFTRSLNPTGRTKTAMSPVSVGAGSSFCTGVDRQC